MQYSFTETQADSQEFRESAPSFTNVPYLLATQLESFSTFLQKADASSRSASPKACKRRFLSAFPIVSHNSLRVEMKFVSYMLSPPVQRARNVSSADSRSPPPCARSCR
jgi:DNA-directed RNA polymerase subunit beta